MARVTVEDCLKRVDNRFSLVHLTAKRVRQLRSGATPHLRSKNKEIVVSLREIAAGDVFPISAEEAEQNLLEAESRERERLAAAQAAVEESPAEPSAAPEEKEE